MDEETDTLADGASEAAACEAVVKVALAARSYSVFIGEGLIARTGQFIASAVPGARCAVVSDANVAPLYIAPLKASL